MPPAPENIRCPCRLFFFALYCKKQIWFPGRCPMQLQLPQLWLLDLRPLMQDERWRAFLPELPIERQTRARSCRREEDAARLTGAGFLLQQALLSLNIPVSEQIFRKNDWGKPYLASHAVEFSLTHASYYAACALHHPGRCKAILPSTGDCVSGNAFRTGAARRAASPLDHQRGLHQAAWLRPSHSARFFLCRPA